MCCSCFTIKKLIGIAPQILTAAVSLFPSNVSLKTLCDSKGRCFLINKE